MGKSRLDYYSADEGGDNMEWVLALTTLVLGLMAGFFLASTGDRNKRRADSLQEQLDNVSAELDEYRNQVTRHFVRTAELVDALAANSREIYNHLAEGSHNLCDADVIKLDQSTSAKIAPESDAASVVVTDTPLHTVKTDAVNEQSTETAATTQPDEGWYEILPESDVDDSSAPKRAAKKKEEEPVV